MGSSFAAGPGITSPADTPPTRCQRSRDNYAHQLARRRALSLTDVSCGGAMTSHILGPWADLPAQVDAVNESTRLVTITIGGNDLGYIGGLMMASCGRDVCPAPAPVNDESYAQLESRLIQIVLEIRRRAPAARVIFVDYPVILPPAGHCANVPISDSQADTSRLIARNLSETTARAAQRSDADFLSASHSEGHDACAPDAWMNGFAPPSTSRDGAPFHPKLASMTAIANALDRVLEAHPTP